MSLPSNSAYPFPIPIPIPIASLSSTQSILPPVLVASDKNNPRRSLNIISQFINRRERRGRVVSRRVLSLLRAAQYRGRLDRQRPFLHRRPSHISRPCVGRRRGRAGASAAGGDLGKGKRGGLGGAGLGTCVMGVWRYSAVRCGAVRCNICICICMCMHGAFLRWEDGDGIG